MEKVIARETRVEIVMVCYLLRNRNARFRLLLRFSLLEYLVVRDIARNNDKDLTLYKLFGMWSFYCHHYSRVR